MTLAELVAEVAARHIDNSYGACISCTEPDSDRDFATAFPCPPARLAALLTPESVVAAVDAVDWFPFGGEERFDSQGYAAALLAAITEADR